MRLLVNGTDITLRCASVGWQGSIQTAARQVTAAIPYGRRAPAPALRIHQHVQLYDGERLLFEGLTVRIQQDGDRVQVTAMDYGYLLANNTGSMTVSDTAENTVRKLAEGIGLTVGELAQTGVRVERTFHDTPYHQIIDTLYTVASWETGEKYHIAFDGHRLKVVRKPVTGGISIPQNAVRTSSRQHDVGNYCNTVHIVDESGRVLKTLGGREAGIGILARTVVQYEGEDAQAQARDLLEQGRGEQVVSMTVHGDTRLLSGEAVVVQDTMSGISGLFWVDADRHTWSGGDYSTVLTLNYQNEMNETQSGRE